MRISQLARKYDLSVQEMVSYLQTLDLPSQSFHPNAKLDVDTIRLVDEHFGMATIQTEQEPMSVDVQQENQVTQPIIVEEPQVEEIQLPTKDPVSSEKNAAVGEQVEAETESAKELTSIKEDETIPSDRLLEMLEAEEIDQDLEKIKLIKAPKKELSGIKVLGKIEIPEPKKKEPKEAPKESKRPQLSEEEKEKRRLKAKKRQEAYELRQEKRKKEKEEKKKKARQEAYYKQTLERTKTQQSKNKPKKQLKQNKSEVVKKEVRPQPKTIVGKLWRWLNSSGYE